MHPLALNPLPAVTVVPDNNELPRPFAFESACDALVSALQWQALRGRQVEALQQSAARRMRSRQAVASYRLFR